jgi:hypothetical protein
MPQLDRQQHAGVTDESKATAPAIELVHEDEVRHYFDAYARALTSGDGRAIAAMWELPALLMSDHGVRAVRNAEEIEKFFAGARGQYAARGIVDTRPDIHDIEWLTPRIVVADVRWPLFDADHKEHGSESSTYTLMRDRSGELKLRIVIMRGETETDVH